MYLREKPKVVCKECEHCTENPCQESSCWAPASRKGIGWDPVTGEEQISNSLCRVVNEDGKCKHYEPRGNA